MTEPKVIVRMGSNGIVKTLNGDRVPTPIPETGEILKPAPRGPVQGSVPPRKTEPADAPSAFTRRGGRHHRRRTGRKTRRHRGGGKMTVIQDGAVWRIKENAPDGTTSMSPQSWSNATDAMQVAKTLKSIKDLTPDQGDRSAVAVAGQTLASLKKGGRSRRRR